MSAEVTVFPRRPESEDRLVLDDYLPYRLSVATNAVSRLIARAYEDRFGLSIPQWRLMAVLAQDGANNGDTKNNSQDAVKGSSVGNCIKM